MRRQDWELQQIEGSHFSERVKQTVKKLLSAVWSQNLSDEEVKEATEALNSLVNDKAIIRDEPQTEYVWEPARPGALVIREWVRVKADAYKGQAGILHNGRQGPIVGIRSGDIIVRYEDDREPKLEFTRHSPHALEKRRVKR